MNQKFRNICDNLGKLHVIVIMRNNLSSRPLLDREDDDDAFYPP